MSDLTMISEPRLDWGAPKGCLEMFVILLAVKSPWELQFKLSTGCSVVCSQSASLRVVPTRSFIRQTGARNRDREKLLQTMAKGEGKGKGMANLVIFKSQLQEYTQKASQRPPAYQTVKEGPHHAPKFRASVVVNGSTYYSPPGFPNVKAAEQAAAQAALEDLIKVNGNTTVPNPVQETGLCKNLLQEYAQKLRIPLPSYSFVRSGEVHCPIFSSTVEIAGFSYSGGAAKTKKEAEIKAARRALLAIQAQSCSSGSGEAVANTASSQTGLYLSRKRERDFEQAPEDVNVVKCIQLGRSDNGKCGISVGYPSKAIPNGQELLTAVYAPEATLVEVQQESSAKQEHGKEEGAENQQKELRTKVDQDEHKGIHASDLLLNYEAKDKNSNQKRALLPQVTEEEQKKQGVQQAFPTSETVHVIQSMAWYN